MDAQQLVLPTPDGRSLAVTRWPSSGPAVVLLHAGVGDRRSWSAVADLLQGDDLDLVAPDRRGSGDSEPGAGPSTATHVDDLLVVLDALALERVLLVGNSTGGALALDAALLHPERVSGVVLLGAAVSGMTDDDTPFDWQPDAVTEELDRRADDVTATTAERVRALAHLWLDGPTSEEGRVGGDARALFEAMNRRILELAAPEPAGDSRTDAWTRLGEVAVPVLCAWGDLDLPCDAPFYEETARRLGQGPARILPGVAHLPGLERPDLVAELVREALAR